MSTRFTFRAAGACAGAVMLGRLAVACSFPAVTFEYAAPDGSSQLPLDGDGGAPEATVQGDDEATTAMEASSPPPDATTSDAGMMSVGTDGGCNFNGTWATRITIDVSWQPQGLTSVILSPGTGTITQWIKGVRTQTGLELSDDSVVCGVSLPDFQATLLGLNEVFGVRFPDSLFDDGYLPPFTVNGALTAQMGGGFAYSTTPTAVVMGLSMTNPTTDPWPSTVTTEIDEDMDGNPGITVAVAQGPVPDATTSGDYSYIPTGIPTLLMPAALASNIYIALRQVTVTSGVVQDCDTISGTVSIPTIASKAAIDSHVLGCELIDGGQCTTGSSSEASFVDNTQPVFTPSGTTTFKSIRVSDQATCAGVRAAFP
jgi:hypothetical protein